MIEQHPELGERILAPIDQLDAVRPIVRACHERYDGLGYPDGLKADEIPLEARIIFACDAFHAMTTDRPYREALPVEVAVDDAALLVHPLRVVLRRVGMFSYGVRLVSMAVSVITLIGSPVFPVAATVVAVPPPEATVVAAPLPDAAAVVAAALVAAAVVAAAVVADELPELSPPHAAATKAPATTTATKAPRRRILKPAVIFCAPPCVRDKPPKGPTRLRAGRGRGSSNHCENLPPIPATWLRSHAIFLVVAGHHVQAASYVKAARRPNSPPLFG